MYVTDEMLNTVLALLVEKGGTVEVCLKIDPNRQHVFYGPPGTVKPEGVELWELCRALWRRGLVSASGIDEATGIETFALNEAGWLCAEGAPIPAPWGDAMAATSDLGYDAQLRKAGLR